MGKPWIVVGGFLVVAGLLFLAVQAWERAKAGRSQRWRPLAVALYCATGAAFSATMYFWFAQVLDETILAIAFAVVPPAIGALLWFRGYRQGAWMDRLAGSTRGRVFRGDDPERPSFGVLPSRFQVAIEVPDHGHRVLGVQYGLGHGEEPFTGSLAKAADAANTYSSVQVRTPKVPAMVIRTLRGAEPGSSRPLEDSQYTMNSLGDLAPAASLEPVELDGELNGWLSVRTEDPEFARAVLSTDVVSLIRSEPWFRLSNITFQDGTLRTSTFGELTENRLFSDSARLTRLAAAIPHAAWRHSGSDATVHEFLTACSEHADRPATHRGAVVREAINRRRKAADRTPVTTHAIVVRTVFALGLLAAGLFLAANPIFGWFSNAQPGEESGVGVVDTIFITAVGMALMAGGLGLAKASFWPARARRRQADPDHARPNG